MSNARRSRTAQNLVPIDAGKKNHAPLPLTSPDPGPLIACLKVKVALRCRDGNVVTRWVEVANYPAECGLDVFYDLIHRFPDDGFLTADALGSISFASIVAIGKPKDPDSEFPVKVEPSPPGTAPKRYERLRVPVGLGRSEIVDVANVPWTEDGIAHFGRVVSKHRRCDFITTDFGFMPVRGVKLEDLRMPGTPADAKPPRLRPEDIASLDDFPE